MHYMKEILKNNRIWVIVYLITGLFNAFMSNYKADCFQKIIAGKLVQQIENGANAGKGVLFDFWFCVVRNLLPTILFSLYFIWKIDRNITYFLMAGYIIVFLVTNLLLKGLYQIKEKILTNEEELNHFLVRGFMEMPVFRMKHQFPNEVKKEPVYQAEKSSGWH